MIPIRIEGRLQGRPYATWAIAVVCTAVLLRLAWRPDERAASILHTLAFVPSRFLAAPWSPDQLVTLVTSALLHAGWVHLAGNVLYLVVFGPTVELRLGRLSFLALYALSGACGALLHAFVHPTSAVPLVGASGAIAGILGAALVLAPHARTTTIIPVIVFIEVASLPVAFVIAMWFALQVASALAPVAQGGASTVAWYAHIGGFAVGTAWGALNVGAARRRPARGRSNGVRRRA
ncbi:MAG TPA: rhomboid family intramembrane serine protease [Coriobacteriia bacterium]|nr:rhomboid family intramembrane serine protease [Coriobacteriia bacterium]